MCVCVCVCVCVCPVVKLVVNQCLSVCRVVKLAVKLVVKQAFLSNSSLAIKMRQRVVGRGPKIVFLKNLRLGSPLARLQEKR